MDPVVTSGIISTGGNVASSAGNFLSELFFGNRNEEWARQDATTAFNRQRQLLNEQRAYESPAAQMRRYIEAGLNPNLIYGQQQGSISAPAVPQASSYSGSAQPFAQGVFDPILDAQLKKAQIDRLQTQNKNDTKITDAEVDEIASRINVNAETVKLLVEQASETRNRILNLGKEWILMDKDEQLKNYQIQMKQKSWQMEVDKLSSELKISEAEAKYASAYFLARLNYVQAGTDDLLASKDLKIAQKNLTEEQYNYLHRIIDDLVDIVSNQASESAIGLKIAQFVEGHTNNWEYWLKNGLNILGQLAAAYANIKSPVSLGSYSVPSGSSNTSVSWH